MKQEQGWTFMHADVLAALPLLKGQVDLVVTDPPYNIGWKYGVAKDKRKDYEEWCETWADGCITALKKDGVLCIINYHENNNALSRYLEERGLVHVNQLIWHYNTNIGQSKRKYTRSYRTILVFAKSEHYVFNPRKQQYKNLNDKRIKQRIAAGHAPNAYDVLSIPLCKNVSKSKRKDGMNQLPDRLVDFLIESYSNKGQHVLDPFVGTGTVCRRAVALGRKATGIDVERWD